MTEEIDRDLMEVTRGLARKVLEVSDEELISCPGYKWLRESFNINSSFSREKFLKEEFPKIVRNIMKKIETATDDEVMMNSEFEPVREATIAYLNMA